MSRRLTDSGLLRKEVCPSDQEVEICAAIRERLPNSSKPKASEAPRFSPRFTGHIMYSTCGKYTKLSCDVDQTPQTHLDCTICDTTRLERLQRLFVDFSASCSVCSAGETLKQKHSFRKLGDWSKVSHGEVVTNLSNPEVWSQKSIRVFFSSSGFAWRIVHAMHGFCFCDCFNA